VRPRGLSDVFARYAADDALGEVARFFKRYLK
jgi:hypothetical protein